MVMRRITRAARLMGSVLWLTAGGFVSVFAAEPVPSSQVDAATVKALLERVDSDRASERTTAARDLQSLGPGVLPHLPPPDRMDTAAARDVVIQIRNVLERQLAKESSHASTVTLKRTAKGVEILAALAAQTGNPAIIANDDTAPLMAVEWQSRPFWEAVDDVLSKSQTDLTWNSKASRFAIIARPQEQRSSVVSHAGAFRMEALVGRLRREDLPSEPVVLRVETTWQAEPRLRPLFLRVKAADWRGTAGTTPVSPWNPEAEYELPFADGTRQLSWPLDLIWSPESKLATWSLQGKAVVHLAAMTESITFDAIALRPNVQRRRGGVAVRIRRAEFQRGDEGFLQATIRIHVSYDAGGPAFESHRAWVFYQGANLIGPKGERIAFTDYEATQEADGAVGVEYRFRDLSGRGSDYQFVYEAPTLFLDVPLDVHFAALPPP